MVNKNQKSAFKMHYLLITVTYAPEKKSAAFMLQTLAEELVKHGNKVTVITFSSSLKEKHKRVTINNVEIILLRAWDTGYSRILRALMELSYSFLIKRYLKDHLAEGFDAVICYSPSIFFGSAISFIKKKWSIKSYLIMRDLFPDWAVQIGLMKKGLVYWFFKGYEKRLIRASDFIGMESREDVKYCNKIKLESNKVEHLPNWMGEVQEANSDIALKYFSEKKINLIYGGALGVAQDFQSFLQILSKVEYKDIRIVIIGQGEQNESIKKIIQANGMDISVLPSLERSQYMDLVKASDAGLIVLNKTLKAHNYPGKSFEYMFFSKPIFAYINKDNEFGKMILKYDFGYVTEGGELEQLSKNLLLLSERKDLVKKGINAKKVLKEKFSVENAASKITQKLSR